ncbi:MAG: geranylgeranyl reductase family protein [Acidobacteria bacterium]|nr:geranylgeranyl reductase family protein [Acidobacteriota bacterium]
MRLEIAIVGAGPAGSWAAYRLARAGATVTIFDHSHPREKPCGGGVTHRALALVSGGIGAAMPPATPIRSAVFEGLDGVRATVPIGTERRHDPLIVASRTGFDTALLEAAIGAGAHLARERVVDVQVAPSGVTLGTLRAAYEASVVIGADGANSLVRRRVLCPFRRSQLSIGTGYFARGVTSSEMIIRFVADPPGYLWSFPRPDHLAIGVCAQADRATAKSLREITADWIRTSAIAPADSLEPYSWPIPSMTVADFDRALFEGDRWLLLGDAAGLVDPLTREGIYFAVSSADMAAAALAGTRRRGDFTDRVRGEIVCELRRAAAFRDRFFQPRFVRLLMRALTESESVRLVMADLIAGRQPYRGLKTRLLGALEVGLAWRLLQMRLAPP